MNEIKAGMQNYFGSYVIKMADVLFSFLILNLTITY